MVTYPELILFDTDNTMSIEQHRVAKVFKKNIKARSKLKKL